MNEIEFFLVVCAVIGVFILIYAWWETLPSIKDYHEKK